MGSAQRTRKTSNAFWLVAHRSLLIAGRPAGPALLYTRHLVKDHLPRPSVRFLSRLHTAVFRTTRGRVGKRLVDNDMLLLTTRGRRSGKRHTVPLLYLRDDGRLVVIASYGGRHHHPDWYRNLAADPLATVHLPGRRFEVIARTADPAERAVWWPQAVAAYEGYAGYQAKTDREIPIVFLEEA